MTNLFTPRVSSSSNERLNMMISNEDLLKIKRGHAWRAEITDLNTNERYLVRGAACGAPNCRCDAVIVSKLQQR